MNYTIAESIQILSSTPSVLKTWLGDLSESWTQSNEGPETWSPFDVLGHLIHGDKTDWIPRLQIILSDDEDKNFTPFDRFAQEKESVGKSMTDLLTEFESLRKNNIESLSSLALNEDDLLKTGIHPEFGEVNAKQLLSTWTIHDLAHIYQIARVMGNQYADEAGPWKNYIRMIKQD